MSKPSKQGQKNADAKRSLVQVRLNMEQTARMLGKYGNITAANAIAKELFLKALNE